MGNWNIYGIALMVGLFFTIVGFILAQIHVTNPMTGTTTSVLAEIFSWW